MDKAWRCSCGGPLDVIFEISEVKFDLSVIRKREPTMWRYRELLPVIRDDSIISLGEGYTPIVTRNVEGVIIDFKLDYMHPTGSFKDRGASVMISHLKELGVTEIVEDSSGNAGAAIAAYSAVAGIKCKIFVPEDAPAGKKLQIEYYGAELVPVKGTREEVHKEALKAAEKAYYAGHMWNPFFIEGLKTISFEYVEQRGTCPDAVFIPVGSGGMFLGIYKGFLELQQLGVIERIPRLIAVQAEGFTPVYDELYGPWPGKRPEFILADGIAIPRPPRLRQIVEALRKVQGEVIVVNNVEVLDALKRLCRLGLFVEPTSAASYAAFLKGIKQRIIEKGERIYIPLTGIGLKAIDKLLKLSR